MAPNHSKFVDIVDIVLAATRPFDDQWKDKPTRIWVSLADKNLLEMVEATIAQIRDQTVPKNILVCFFQKFIGGCDIELMRKYLNQIRDETLKQKWNKVIVSTCYFVPSHEQIWGIVGLFNLEAHRINADLGMPRMNLHRAIMTQMSELDKTLRVRALAFIEYQLGLSLGTHLSYEGYASIVNLVNTVFDTAFKFQKKQGKKKSRQTRKVVPPSLAITPGYVHNVFMRQILTDKRIIRRDPRNPITKRMHWSDQKLPGHQNWQVFREQGPMRRFQEREGYLAAHLWMLKRADKVPVWCEDEEDESEEEEVQEVQQQLDEDRPYDPEEEWVTDPNLCFVVTNKPDGEIEVITENVAQMEVDEQKEKKKGDYNEDLIEIKRMFLVEQEKNKSYRAEMDKKMAVIAKERAAAKYWREQYEAKVEKLNFVEKEFERIKEQYKFLRNTYKAKQELKGKKKV